MSFLSIIVCLDQSSVTAPVADSPSGRSYPRIAMGDIAALTVSPPKNAQDPVPDMLSGSQVDTCGGKLPVPNERYGMQMYCW